ncbi:hypothetical protein D3C71_1011590 [compost metagenome]
MNTQQFGIQRFADTHRLIVNADFTLVMVMRAAQHRHQRRLSGPVCPRQRMDGTARKREIYARQCLKPRKGQADTAHLKATGTHPLSFLLI